jgi:hypothetical protein
MIAYNELTGKKTDLRGQVRSGLETTIHRARVPVGVKMNLFARR